MQLDLQLAANKFLKKRLLAAMFSAKQVAFFCSLTFPPFFKTTLAGFEKIAFGLLRFYAKTPKHDFTAFKYSNTFKYKMRY